jgi:hypothetical protein
MGHFEIEFTDKLFADREKCTAKQKRFDGTDRSVTDQHLIRRFYISREFLSYLLWKVWINLSA